ncbi:hypothetical protein UCRPC4_g06029 [Phaeomoniella chlamydospora]|uniref:Uncharacterized protein n=1 Tax=Phaeomoniella chlamydospora TaxID=158046 RepID=A0A0G2FW16_PHACM|nr:hypothetical protein UCRPC4_g06029 [Phaeomoniella chlamydospora]
MGQFDGAEKAIGYSSTMDKQMTSQSGTDNYHTGHGMFGAASNKTSFNSNQPFVSTPPTPKGEDKCASAPQNKMVYTPRQFGNPVSSPLKVPSTSNSFTSNRSESEDSFDPYPRYNDERSIMPLPKPNKQVAQFQDASPPAPTCDHAQVVASLSEQNNKLAVHNHSLENERHQLYQTINTIIREKNALMHSLDVVTFNHRRLEKQLEQCRKELGNMSYHKQLMEDDIRKGLVEDSARRQQLGQENFNLRLAFNNLMSEHEEARIILRKLGRHI